MRDAIGGNCRTTCIANIWPEPPNNKETISTFQFAGDLGKVRNNARINTLEPVELRIEKLEQERHILEADQELQSELGGAIRIDGLKQDEEVQTSHLVQRFLADELDEIPLPSLAHIRSILQEIKRCYLDIPNQVMREVTKLYNLTERIKNPKAPKDVGTIDGTGFSIGVAASQDRPANIRTTMKSDRQSHSNVARPDNPPPPTRDQMFEIYKLRDGKQLAADLMQGKRETRELMEKKKDVVSQINGTQAELGQFRAIIEANNLREKFQVFEDEARVLKGEVAAKVKYRELYQVLQRTQTEIDALKEKSAHIRTALLSAFEDWHGKWQRNELYTQKVVPPRAELEALQLAKDAGKMKGKPPIRPIKPKTAPRGGRK
jgi:hypothetical protein